jgi:hypothetical protein
MRSEICIEEQCKFFVNCCVSCITHHACSRIPGKVSSYRRRHVCSMCVPNVGSFFMYHITSLKHYVKYNTWFVSRTHLKVGLCLPVVYCDLSSSFLILCDAKLFWKNVFTLLLYKDQSLIIFRGSFHCSSGRKWKLNCI